ncbi:MAG: hypothetical protein Q8O47_04520, partial [Candidatus Bathyarchaeota archaeon]|nr:hypothetical protein [Candidatus Bathyarchaeota archaeon]
MGGFDLNRLGRGIRGNARVSLRDDVKEKRKKMNMRKTLPLLVIASMKLSLIPSVMFANAAVTATINVSTGSVGTKVVVSGTINSYNGHYSIGFDDDANTGTPDVVLVAIGTASGYSFSKEITIPDAYFGARRIRVTDLDATGNPASDAFFTVETSYAVTKNYSTNYEG